MNAPMTSPGKQPGRARLKLILPLAVLFVGIAMAVILVRTRPAAETRARDVPPPLVRVHTVELQDLQLRVHSQGTVHPRTRTALVSQVHGRVVHVSPAFESGGFFEADEVLLRIDPTDFELAVVRARAVVAQAEVRLAMERAEAEVAKREWEDLGTGEASPLVMRAPQLMEAEAALEAARASLQQAEVDLDRTRIRVPFPGRVSTKKADVGQYVLPGVTLGDVYAIDYAEVRLPIPDDELAYLDAALPRTALVGDTALRDPEPRHDDAPRVVLSTHFAGAAREWAGQIVRTEGEIDPRTRMIHIIARVADPYGRAAARDAPLAAGLFVHAEIMGKTVHDVAVVPRGAMRTRDQVLIVDDDDRLRFRDVLVLRGQRDNVIVQSGLRDGERVLLSPLEAVTDGMRVRTQADANPDAGEAHDAAAARGVAGTEDTP